MVYRFRMLTNVPEWQLYITVQSTLCRLHVNAMGSYHIVGSWFRLKLYKRIFERVFRYITIRKRLSVIVCINWCTHNRFQWHHVVNRIRDQICAHLVSVKYYIHLFGININIAAMVRHSYKLSGHNAFEGEHYNMLSLSVGCDSYVIILN